MQCRSSCIVNSGCAVPLRLINVGNVASTVASEVASEVARNVRSGW